MNLSVFGIKIILASKKELGFVPSFFFNSLGNLYKIGYFFLKCLEEFIAFVEVFFSWIFEFYFILFFIQQVLISHQFYTHQCTHVNPNLPIHHTTTTTPLPLSPLGVHTFVLHICVSISALQIGSSVPFF